MKLETPNQALQRTPGFGVQLPGAALIRPAQLRAVRPARVKGLRPHAALGAWHLVTHDTLVRQHMRMRAARDHLSTLAPLLASDPAFLHVVCSDYSGAGGALILHGRLADEATFERLRALVASTHPPVTVVYQLQSDTEVFDAFVQHP